MSAYSVAQLIVTRTVSAVLTQGLAVATSLGVDTTTWRTGDPTRSTYSFLATVLAQYDSVVAEFIKAGFLSSASGPWLQILAVDLYGVTPTAAAPATSQVTISNTGGGTYPIGAGDLTFKSTLSGKTYRNVSAAPTLAPGATLTISVVADEAGSGSSAGANEIDQLVTTKLGVVVASSTAAVGIDAQSDDSIKTQCTASLGALSPSGAADAYEYVARNAALTGVLDITRARSIGDNTTLTVTVYVASPSGPVAAPSVAAAQAAIMRWATPLCVLPTVVNATSVVINVTASIHGAALPADAQARIAAALNVLMQSQAIGVGAGYDVDPTAITTVMRNTVPQIETIVAYTPSAAVHIAAGAVPVIGTVNVAPV